MAKPAGEMCNVEAGDLAGFDLLQTPVWVFDIDGMAMWWANRAALALWRAASVEELRQRDFSDSSPLTRSRLAQYRAGFVRGERFVERWTLFPGSDPVSMTCACQGVRLEQSRLGMLVEADDVMALDRHRSAESLRLAQFALDKAAGLVLWTVPDGAIFYANDTCRQALGWSEGQLLSMTLQELRTPGSRAAWPAWWERLREQRTLVEDARFVRREGGFLDVELTACYLAYGGSEFAFVFALDIAARRQSEALLLASQRRLQDFAEIATDWFWESGPDHRFTWFSDRLVAFGFDPARSLGRTRVEMAQPGDPDQAKWVEHQRILDVHAPFRDFTYDFARPGKTTMTVAVSGKPMFARDGGFLGYRGTARDVTVIARSERALVEAKEQAEVANRIKSEFLAIVSHELRTPLNAIIGFSDVMVREIFGPLEDRYRTYAGHIHDSGAHLLKVINDILDLSKIEAGRLDLHEEVIDLAAAISSCIELVRGRAVEREIDLSMGVPDGLPPIRADEIKLKQIVINLLSNAIKFTGAGGRIRVLASHGPAGIELVVRDSGIGMSAAEVEIALQPFRQVDNRQSRKYQGTGLGLPLSRRLAELHGGSLDVVSKPGIGTTVTIRLPASCILEAATTHEGRA